MIQMKITIILPVYLFIYLFIYLLPGSSNYLNCFLEKPKDSKEILFCVESKIEFSGEVKFRSSKFSKAARVFHDKNDVFKSCWRKNDLICLKAIDTQLITVKCLNNEFSEFLFQL